ncbi:MAG TPA: transcription antitermination factor NusB [Gemmatimonadales bacterium]
MTATGLGARRAAYAVLRAVQGGEPFDQALGRSVGDLQDDDRRLAHELAAGVLRHRSDLDARLQPLVHRGWSSVGPELRDVLRLGAYQLSVLDRIPPHAAVSTTVELARSALGERAARFANAILRGMGGRAAPPARSGDPAAHLADRYSHPLWLVRRWLERFGMEETEQLLAWNNRRPALALQPARASLESLQRELWEHGVAAERAPFDAGLRLTTTRPAELPGYEEGHFVVQDGAQALVCRFAQVPVGGTIYDACAAPGGKSVALGRTANRVLAGELSPDRASRLAENLRRAGSGREFVIVASAAEPPVRSVDLLLLDAPCLGTGALARHPDARWRVTLAALHRLTEQQRQLLSAVAPVVRPGGWLVYATCSLEPEENENQVNAFLTRRPDFHRDPGHAVPAELLTPAGDLLVLPMRHGLDGAYAARLRKAG